MKQLSFTCTLTDCILLAILLTTLVFFVYRTLCACIILFQLFVLQNFSAPLQYTVAIMGYGPEDKNTVLELTYNYGVNEYDKGDGYAQVSALIFTRISRMFHSNLCNTNESVQITPSTHSNLESNLSLYFQLVA